MKDSKKRKSEQNSERKAKKQTLENTQQKEVVKTKNARGDFWRAEIDALRQESFVSVDQVVSSLTEKVLNRFGPKLGNESMREETKEFLTLLFETDETIRSELETFVRR